MNRRGPRGSFLIFVVLISTAGYAFSETCYLTNFSSFPSPSSNSAGPLNVVALGSSVMWGDGLHTEHTFRYQVAEWLATTTDKPVRLWTFAHSAAFLKVISGTGTLSPDPRVGALNGNWPEGVYPAVTEQVNCAAGRHSLGDANLVLVDGCINEVNAETIVDPRTDTDDLIERTRTYCLGTMQQTLEAMKTSFSKATIVVVAYFPVVSAKSTVSGSSGTRRLAGYVKKKSQHKMVLPTGPLKSRNLGKSDEANVMVVNSEVFYLESKKAIQLAIDNVNGSTPPHIYFAKLPEIQLNGVYTIDPEFAYGAPRTQEWLFPFQLLWFRINPDEEFGARRVSCKRAYPPGFDRLVCDSNAAFHPNPKRSSSYANSIEQIFPQTVLTEWKSH